MTIAVLGAAGAVGKSIGATLAEKGQPFVVVGRSKERLAKAFPGAEHRAADLETKDGARAAVRGVKSVVMTLGLPYWEFARYPALMQNLVDACVAEGVERFVHVSNVYVYGLPKSEFVTEAQALEPCSFKGKMRLEQERILLAAHTAGKLKAMVLRPPDYFGADAELSISKGILDAAVAQKTADLLGPCDTPHQLVYTPDLGPILWKMLQSEKGWGEAYNFAGSGIITMREFALKMFAAAGAKPKLRIAGKGMMRFLGLFMPVMKELVEMNYLQSTPVNLGDAKLEALIGPLVRTSYDVGIAASIAEMRRRAS